MENGQLTTFLANRPAENPLKYVSYVVSKQPVTDLSRKIRHVISGLDFIHSLNMVHADLKGVRGRSILPYLFGVF
jgi:serine/threonine protein kinase